MTKETTQTKPARAKRFARTPSEGGGGTEPAGSDETAVTPAPARDKKIDRVIALLGREDGATLAELIEATGWLPHTTRAALTGLRKRGHEVERLKRGDVTCYRIVGEG